MKLIKRLSLNGVVLLEPNEELNSYCYSNVSYNNDDFDSLIGKKVSFTEDRVFSLKQAEIQGLHYQIQDTQGTLITVLRGEVYCVAVDIMKNSRFLGHWRGEVLSQKNHTQMWIPEGYARGWLSLTNETLIYSKYTKKCNEYYQRYIHHDDPIIGIKWPLIPYEYPIALGYIVNNKDGHYKKLKDSELLEVTNE
ncbi:dTDP-4-dehydrorhamnose 3,5-epimerase [Leptospirillum ferrooxidans]|uniref:dTDP-4-dehydrorhamnose 3,5-epimerase n=1 Tax=Leptospirillum ferrooxidans (strain C2-3) TaxID=1162668 RepID=I0IP27_LEPFC|nr:dTDP-4-dehydrorhamnose 3,5-epimerase [Leptospirillum ferrooxidans]BAM07026.1 putative dTDP-4-dehydrorhamnose 3,5-epimerase [Leptospirillum ferrooxidans C2-3]